MQRRAVPAPWLAAAAAAFALLAIAAAPWALDVPLLNFVFKPLATLTIIVHAWQRGAGLAVQRRWVLVGLWLSLAGDVALLWPQQGFLPGLLSFLLAHLAYLMAFTTERRLAAWPPALVGYAVLAALILALLWPGIPGSLRAPVVAYVLCLSAMAAQTAVLWHGGLPRARILAAGGALFLLSDALLASNKFASPLPWASLWILSSYWAAQWCIASGLPAATTAGSPPAR